MLYYLEHKADQKGQFWQVEMDGLLLETTAGKLGEAGQQEQMRADSHEDAFRMYKDAIIQKLKENYYDPKNNYTAVDFEDATFEMYLEQQEYEKAEAWLLKFDGLIDGSREDRLINSYVEEKKYRAAEKYILNNIKNSKSADIVIRQVRYLAVVNPMMCRFMIGNLPLEPQVKDTAAYYRNLAVAQSGIGMLDAADATLGRIKELDVQFVYLAHLLITPHKNLALQLKLLDQAVELLEQPIWKTEDKVSNYLLLGKMAQGLGEVEKANEFLAKAKDLLEVQ